MITLLQQTNNLIGSVQAIKELKEKKHARILIISDTHGSYHQLLKIVKQFGPDCDALVLCGDCNRDLCELLETANEDSDFQNTVPPVIAFVRGNCDSPIFPVSFDIGKDNLEAKMYPKGSVIFPDSQILTVNNQKIFICHGNKQYVDFGYEPLYVEMEENQCFIALHGHTHVPVNVFSYETNYRIINPGSISRPRGGFPSTFAILTVEDTFVDTAFLKTGGYLNKYEIIRI